MLMQQILEAVVHLYNSKFLKSSQLFYKCITRRSNISTRLLSEERELLYIFWYAKREALKKYEIFDWRCQFHDWKKSKKITLDFYMAWSDLVQWDGLLLQIPEIDFRSGARLQLHYLSLALEGGWTVGLKWKDLTLTPCSWCWRQVGKHVLEEEMFNVVTLTLHCSPAFQDSLVRLLNSRPKHNVFLIVWQCSLALYHSLHSATPFLITIFNKYIYETTVSLGKAFANLGIW